MASGKMPFALGSSNAVLGKGYGRGDGSLMLSTISGLAGRLEVVVPKIVRIPMSGAFDDSRVESVITESVRVPVSGVFGSPVHVGLQQGSPMSGIIHGGSTSSVLCDLQYGATSQSISEFGRVADQVLLSTVRSRNHGSDAVEVIPPVSVASSIVALPPTAVPNGHVRSGVMNRVHSVNVQQEVNGGRVDLGGFLGFPTQDATNVQNGRGG
ncbi:hypothetical protein NE237_031855 [Protea cynaroides]|uniref:Uncharacterized protein n=1 Tax=Protea cynaroides TaxID=273540 RepID=A0A9Q0L212_9MAGN|nr:hypothetical protein NE237_031855 [Protea cynaroides]